MCPRGKIRDFSLGESVSTRGMCVRESKFKFPRRDACSARGESASARGNLRFFRRGAGSRHGEHVSASRNSNFPAGMRVQHAGNLRRRGEI